MHRVHRLAVVSAVSATLLAGSSAPGSYQLTLLHTGDSESSLISAPGQANYGGVARFKTRLDLLRAGAVNPLVLNSGDTIIPSPQFDASLQLPAGTPFYDSVALNALRYDASVVGNHEFDLGPATFRRFLDGLTPQAGPFLSANLSYAAEPQLAPLVGSKLARSRVVTLGGEQVGIVGATTETLATISSPGNTVVSPILSSVQSEVNTLRGSGINKIVLVTQNQALANDALLITQLRGVDVVVSGGGEETVANPGTPLVPGDSRPATISLGSLGTVPNTYPILRTDADGMPVALVAGATRYKYVGELNLRFDAAGVLDTSAGNAPAGDLRRVSGNAVDPDFVSADPTLQSDVVNPVSAHVAGLAAVRIARSTVALEGRRSGPNNTGIRRTETNLGNLVADSLRWQAARSNAQAANPWIINASRLIGIQNGGGIRNDTLIPAAADAGPNISRLNTFEINAFSNFVALMEITPGKLEEILEHAVSRVEFNDGRFAQVSGFSFVWDRTLPAGSRVLEAVLADGTDLIVDGRVVAGAPSLYLATIDFLANGGDAYPLAGIPFLRFPVSYQQGLENFITSGDAHGGLLGLDGRILQAEYPIGGEGRIIVVPEPATLSLMVAAGVLAMRRRRV
jgi:5'-nucleotidase